MEASDFQSKTVKESITSKKPHPDIIIKRKTLATHLRSTTESVRDVPPLTPLHRLQRFKAIRDRNLKNKLKKTISKNSFLKKMEETKKSDTAVFPLKSKKKDTECVDTEGSNISTHEQNDRSTNGVTNGHDCIKGNNELSSAAEGTTTKVDLVESSVKEPGKDISQNNVAQGEEEKGSHFIEKTELVESSNEEGKENTNKDSLPENEQEKDNTNEKIFHDSLDNDDGSSSTSTFPSVKEFINSSTEDISDNKNESSDDEEIDVGEYEVPGKLRDDMLSINKMKDESENEVRSSTHESTPSDKISLERNLNAFQESTQKGYLASKIPRSVSSVSSYKTAYEGSTRRISGRRPVTRLEPLGRKRKAEDNLDFERNGMNSPSVPSPHWRFFPSSLSGLWSPQKTPFVSFSNASTPSRQLDDSMAVNVNEESINFRLNESDFISNPNDTTLPSKKIRWGCNVM